MKIYLQWEFKIWSRNFSCLSFQWHFFQINLDELLTISSYVLRSRYSYSSWTQKLCCWFSVWISMLFLSQFNSDGVISFKEESITWLSVNLTSIDDRVFKYLAKFDQFPQQFCLSQPFGDDNRILDSICLVLSSTVLPERDLQLLVSVILKLWPRDFVTSSSFWTLFVVLLSFLWQCKSPFLHFDFVSNYIDRLWTYKTNKSNL